MLYFPRIYVTIRVENAVLSEKGVIPIYMPFVWLAVVILAAVLEASTAQLVSIWFVVGGVGALIASLLDAPFPLQLLIFALVTAVTLIATRPFVKKMLDF